MGRLLVFTENYAKGGGNKYLIDLINSLGEVANETFLYSNAGGIYPEDTSRLNRKINIKSVSFITQPLLLSKLKLISNDWRRAIGLPLRLLEPFFYICNIARFSLLCYRLKPTRVLACNGGYPASQACLALVIAASLLNIPTALSIVSMPAKRRKLLFWYEKALDNLVWRSSDCLIVNANAIAQALSKQRGMPLNKSHVIHNGLDDLKSTNPVEDTNIFVIGCVARLDRSKGVLFLFDAFVTLLQKHPNLRLVLVGSGDAYDELTMRTSLLGLQGRVNLPGHFIGDISTLLATFDIYVFPSLWEGFPYSILEALRSGCVIVATNVGGIPEAIADGVDGILIEPGCSAAIAGAVDGLINNQEFCAELSKNARLKFQRNFTLKEMEKRVQEVLL